MMILVSGIGRQLHDKLADKGIVLRGIAQGAAAVFDDGPRQREPQAEPLIDRLARRKGRKEVVGHLGRYAGAIVLVSHDRHLLRNSVEQLLLVNEGTVEDYAGDVETYEKWVLSSNPAEAPKPAAPQAAAVEDAGDRKARRQASANQRAQLQPLKKSLRALEQRIEKGQQALQTLQAKLADGDLYAQNASEALADLLKQEGQLKRELAALENEWLEQQEALDALEDAAS